MAAIIVGNPKGDVEVWPENWPAWQFFLGVSTQWRVGMNGATGLCYEAIYPLLDRRTSSADEWDERFDDLQEIERAALKAMSAGD